jgi:hypothetical protein
MTMRKNSSSLKKFDRYEHMINDLGLENLFIGLLKSGVKDFDLSATLGRLEKYIPEFSEFREAIQSAASITALNTPAAPKSQKIRREILKRTELLRERAVQLQISMNSSMATHFLFFDSFDCANEGSYQMFKEILAEPSTNETWRFPEIKWSPEKIRAGIALAQYSESQELASWDLMLTAEGINEFKELALEFKSMPTEDEGKKGEDIREELQVRYRNLLLAQGASKNRALRLPTLSQLDRIAKAVSDLSGQSRIELTDSDSMSLISEKSESSNILTDFVVRAMSWGAQNKVEFNFLALLEKVKELNQLDDVRGLDVKGIKLHLRRSGTAANVDTLCTDIEKFYVSEMEPQRNLKHDSSEAVQNFAQREAERVDSLLESYIQKLVIGFSEISEQKENLDEYIIYLKSLFEKSKLQKQIVLDVEDYLASLGHAELSIEVEDA